MSNINENMSLLEASRLIASSLAEIIDLCAVGDVDETTEGLGWGKAIKEAKERLDQFNAASLSEPRTAAKAWLVDGRMEQGLTFDKDAADTMAEANCGTVRPLFTQEELDAAIAKAIADERKRAEKWTDRWIDAVYRSAADHAHASACEILVAPAPKEIYASIRALSPESAKETMREFMREVGTYVAVRAAVYGWSLGMEGADTKTDELQNIVNKAVEVWEQK